MSIHRRINDILFSDPQIEPNVEYTDEELLRIEEQDIWYPSNNGEDNV